MSTVICKITHNPFSFIESIVIFQNIKNPDNKYFIRILKDIAKTYHVMGEIKKALEYLEKSLLIANNEYNHNYPKISEILSEIG